MEGKAMGIMEFAAAVKRHVQERMGEGYDFSLEVIKKNNEVEMPALCICRTGNCVSAVFYMDEYLAMYREGEGMECIAERIAERFRKKGDISMDVKKLNDYEGIKALLMVKLVNTGKNCSFLKGVPHEEFLDLSIVPVILWKDENGDYGTVVVKRPLVRAWGVTEGELLLQAKVNAQKIMPYELICMEEVLKQECPPEDASTGWEQQFLVLTNRDRHLGAAAILCPDALEEAWEKFGRKDFYVLPSSIHDVLLLPADEGIEEEELRDMVRSVNRTEVDEEEFLSDDIYVYRGECGKLEMIKSNES